MNDRPGIMLASAVAATSTAMASAPGRNLTLFATNDDAHRTAVEMQAAGLRVAAVIDSRTGVEKRGDYRLIEGGQVVTTKGRHGLRQITVSHGGRTEEIDHRLPRHVGRLEPLGAPDLPPRRAARLGRRRQGLPARAERRAGHDPRGRLQRGDVDGGLPAEGKEAAKEALKTLGLSAKRSTLPKASDDAGEPATPCGSWRARAAPGSTSPTT
jgi:hypothetical protein